LEKIISLVQAILYTKLQNMIVQDKKVAWIFTESFILIMLYPIANQIDNNSHVHSKKKKRYFTATHSDVHQ